MLKYTSNSFRNRLIRTAKQNKFTIFSLPLMKGFMVALNCQEFNTNTVKLGYNEQQGTREICLL
jgi:hypothetical protein